jgi:hypothetical protein
MFGPLPPGTGAVRCLEPRASTAAAESLYGVEERSQRAAHGPQGPLVRPALPGLPAPPGLPVLHGQLDEPAHMGVGRIRASQRG